MEGACGIVADGREMGNVWGTCVGGLLGGENGWDHDVACEGTNCNCNCNCNVEFVKHAKILLTVKTVTKALVRMFSKLIGDTNMFSVLSRIHDTTLTNHAGSSQHYSSPADQLLQKLAVQKFLFVMLE